MKQITHDKIKSLLNTMHEDDVECKFTGRINKLFDYVEEQEMSDERAKKVEELSTLKTELILAYHTLDLHKWKQITLTNLEHACWCKTRDDLIEQIKIKEKELEELK